MKKIFAIMLALISIISLPACSFDTHFGFSKNDFIVVEEENTHGGFHGDGSYHLILDCSNNTETALKIVNNWNRDYHYQKILTLSCTVEVKAA